VPAVAGARTWKLKVELCPGATVDGLIGTRPIPNVSLSSLFANKKSGEVQVMLPVFFSVIETL
jgi:hypothetical protein